MGVGTQQGAGAFRVWQELTGLFRIECRVMEAQENMENTTAGCCPKMEATRRFLLIYFPADPWIRGRKTEKVVPHFGLLSTVIFPL